MTQWATWSFPLLHLQVCGFWLRCTLKFLFAPLNQIATWITFFFCFFEPMRIHWLRSLESILIPSGWNSFSRMRVPITVPLGSGRAGVRWRLDHKSNSVRPLLWQRERTDLRAVTHLTLKDDISTTDQFFQSKHQHRTLHYNYKSLQPDLNICSDFRNLAETFILFYFILWIWVMHINW